MKNRIWIIVFSAVFVLCILSWMYISNISLSKRVVGIYQNGRLIEKIDLNTVSQEREITVSGECGKNTILVSHEYIKMKSAECPDKICVKHGELKSLNNPIVCLPNKIVIKFEGEAENVDAKTGAVK